ncbi:MAG: amidase family protein [Pseudomonadota bacterium]
MDDWLNRTAADLGRDIEKGAIDPKDLTEVFLSAIGAHRHRDRVYARLTEDRARAEATAASDRAKRGLRRSPLDGVPISWKDLYDSGGVATESGTALLAGRTPTKDATVLANATEAGLVCLGKTHQTEFAFSGLGLNPVTASPPCVNDEGAVSGGSSSGAGTSVAFGLAAVGIGSDTGGSVRIPSVWNDLVGLKTMHGRLPLTGVLPLCAKFDTVGPLCRTVEDAALTLAVLENGKPADLTGVSLSGMRFGLLKSQAFNGTEEKPLAAFEAAVVALEKAGAVVQPLEIDAVDAATRLGPILFPAEAYAQWRDRIEADGDKMYPPVRTRFLQGKTISAADYIAAWHQLDDLRLMYRDAVAGFDAVILPSCPIMPPQMDALLADDAFFTERNLMALQNTRIGNILGLAAITLPTVTPSCGLMLQGESEERLLRIAAAMEHLIS